MSRDTTDQVKSKTIIDAVEPTDEILSGRAGLSLISRFPRHGGWLEQIAAGFTALRNSRKGQPVAEVFKQLICFFFDGSRRHRVHFDHLKQDAGHAAVIESTPRWMLSSHAVKRFFMAFRQHHLLKFRLLLRSWFITQLRVEQPEVVVLGLDSVVLDNDGFYRVDVPILVRMDAGFMDQEIFEWCESQQVGYICGGKLYDDVKTVAAGFDSTDWSRLERPGQIWQYVEWADRRGNWKRFRHVI
jgi:hypothetical protein